MTVTTSFHLLRNIGISSTQVTFSQGVIRETSKIVNIVQLREKIALILEKTPFHPIDSHWPDQPGDLGTLTLPALNKVFSVDDCQVWAIHKETQRVEYSHNVPRSEKQQWFYVVAHIVLESPEFLESALDSDVIAEVDEVYRKNLSLHHTASHLAACALNKVLTNYWKKMPDLRDSLNHPNTDQLAIEQSSIYPDRSEETYRLGKSLKKKGLKTDEVLTNLQEIENAVQNLINAWIATGAEITMSAPDADLESKRVWLCELPIGVAEIPCGGTHLARLSEIGSICYKLIPLNQEGESRFQAIIQATHTG